MNTTRKNAGLFALGLVAAVAMPLLTDTVHAADHVDAPKTKAFLAGDITDVYAWHTGDGKVVAVLDFAGFGEAGLPATFDADVLYTIHIDNNNDNLPDQEAHIRFGKNSKGAWGVQVSGLPGGKPVVTGPVETTIDAGMGLRVYAGLRDDPFFFDLDGFNKTVQTGTLSFDNKHDTFATTNVTAIVVEMSTDALVGNGKTFRLWASTRVKP
ncbi:DUF4331 family protein [Nannocystis sp.]|uniref:DUF4331 family protein n=1 Tax=Nannocystis sp. TaxID=1962667 RepID=UPI0024286B49|nr:DUF4331 family protein [Nannocystis sp.]MBK7827723.1 DUF4331 family protein [Nannocystis sp.]MBK9753763.1 DUF4331 family protein [Nannocystis sp.]